DVERAHRDLEAFAFGADAAGRRNAAGVEAKARERVRRDDVDALGDREAGRVGVDDEGADAARALGGWMGRVAGSREDDVEVGEADRARAEALHREREVGEAVVTRERVAREADRARVDGVVDAAVLAAGDGMREPARLAERADERSAGGVDLGAVVAVRVREVRRRPGVELAREGAV